MGKIHWHMQFDVLKNAENDAMSEICFCQLRLKVFLIVEEAFIFALNVICH